MSVVDFFAKKCAALLEENVNLVLLRLSDPASFVSVNFSGALADAAKGGAGSLANFAEDYLAKNADKVAIGVLKGTGFFDKVKTGLDIAMNLITSMIAFNNDLVFMFMKKVAQSAVKEIERKEKILGELNETLLRLLNAMESLDRGDPVFNQYIADLRKALVEVHSADQKITLVGNTLARTDFWLSRTWIEAKEHLKNADELIRPLEDNPYMELSVNGLAANLGLGHLTTSNEQQKQNVIAIPRLTNQLIIQVQGYLEATARLNGLLSSFSLGLSQITSALPSRMKAYVLDLLSSATSDIQQLKESMASSLNGSPSAYFGPVSSSFRPKPLQVSVMTYKWLLDLNMILEFINTVPEETLSNLNLATGALQAYERAVSRLKAIDTYTQGTSAIVRGEDGTEEVLVLETQLLTLMIEANAALASASVRKEAISLGRSIVSRNNLVLKRDADIKSILTTWINTPIPGEENLKRIMESIARALDGWGLARAKDLLEDGNFTDFFKLNARDATYAGAALTALALLKECFDTAEDEQELEKVQREVEREEDLLNVDISFNFDLAIVGNIEECVRLTNLSTLFSRKELLCGILEKTGVGSAFSKVQDLVSF